MVARPRLKLNRVYRLLEPKVTYEVLVLVESYYSDSHTYKEEYLLRAISPNTFHYIRQDQDDEPISCAWFRGIDTKDFQELPDNHPAQVLYGKK